jgi:MoaA/NifB/PqqE/SkfB family radical SAM enzyme
MLMATPVDSDRGSFESVLSGLWDSHNVIITTGSTTRMRGEGTLLMDEQYGETRSWPLRSVYFYLTPECNLACRHCWISPRFQNAGIAKEYLPTALLSSIIGQALPLGLTSIKLTGGEPLLYPGIFRILEIAREHNLEVNVETNGTLVTPEFARTLAGAERRFISVSLDGADARTHE